MFEQSYQNQFNADEGLRRHVQRTFGWMAVGLLITALSAAFFYFTGISMQIVLTSSAFMWLGILLQLGVVVAFMSGLHRRNLGMTRMACPDMQYVDAFVKMLDEVDRFEIKGAELTLFDDHKALAVFKAVEKEPAKQ